VSGFSGSGEVFGAMVSATEGEKDRGTVYEHVVNGDANYLDDFVTVLGSTPTKPAALAADLDPKTAARIAKGTELSDGFISVFKNDWGIPSPQLTQLKSDLASAGDDLMNFFADKGKNGLKAWEVAFQHGDNIRLNTGFLSNLSKYLDDYPNLKPDLEDLDVFNAYKKIADDVEQSYEILDDVEGNLALLISQKTQNTGAPDFWKWIHRGKKFEKDLVLPKFKNRSSAEYLQLKNKASTEFGVDLNQYDMYAQVQLKHNGSDYFVADQVYIKWVDVNGQQVIDDIVVVENKLKSTTRLTTNQNAGKAASSLEVRSVNLSPESAVSGNNLTNQLPSINTNDKWLKVYDSENGDVISGIDKL